MSNIVYVIRFFRVVPPNPPLMTGCLLAITVVAAFVTTLTDDREATAVVPIVVLQAFSAATGFVAPARRGYFDLLIARGEPRARIAIIQWLTAIAPGLCSWLTLAILAMLVDMTLHPPVLESGTAVAFLMASTIPWAITVALPRFSGAIGWLLLICLASTGGVMWPDSVRHVVFPLDLVGHRVGGRLDVLCPALLLSVTSIVLGLLWVHRSDIPLEAAQ